VDDCAQLFFEIGARRLLGLGSGIVHGAGVVERLEFLDRRLARRDIAILGRGLRRR
jgi:hypothetical protein